MTVLVLRLGHRVPRDIRVTTHVGLVARALGADGIVLTGDYDKSVLETWRSVVERWGGPFSFEYVKDWRRYAEGRKAEGWEIVHLTMYGLPVSEVIEEIRCSAKPKLVLVGSEKVPGLVFKLADWNVAVSSQPHSECGSLAVFLDRLFSGRELTKEFQGGKVRVVPQRVGKKVVRLEDGTVARAGLAITLKSRRHRSAI
ncbi:MAG: tRNA (cytidine(56)-2'-O)-methyltransferase [Candidatus Bathyarchaeia archaeon]